MHTLRCPFEEMGNNTVTDSYECIEMKVDLNTTVDINQNEQQANNFKIQNSSPVVCEEGTSSISVNNEAVSNPDLEIIEVISSNKIPTKRRKICHSFSSDGSLLDFGYKSNIGKNSEIGCYVHRFLMTVEKYVELKVQERTEPVIKEVKEMGNRMDSVEKKVENRDKSTALIDAIMKEIKKETQEDNSLMSSPSTEVDID